MKTANKLRSAIIKTTSLTVLAGSLTLLSACSGHTLKIQNDFKETPEISRSNMSNAIGCMSTALRKSDSNNAYVFLVRDINDGTVKEGPYQDSPLSDAGRIQMLNILSDHLNPQVGLVTDNFPLMFSQTGKEDSGLNRFGLPAPQNLDVFMSAYHGIIQNARQSKGLSAASNIIPLVVSGSFTRFDSDNLSQEGMGKT
ncbi:hypothetical protein [Candidatus Thiothrix anitrata]|uniref:Uncharacterized protein n=1 Tax=Candidatus Thiothrix anitrata TaxID=2823902 RepID=A0ABX7X3Z7_9GAMM|nr:hypothetical protein [Candidatus Thiothrix anitrata]QTR50526.1 hypothetical protein J8380_02855 [Candidatus Thiothrix anitrata]